MRKVYHFKMLRTAALILIGAPAFVAAGLLLIRLHPGNLPVRIAGYAGILFFGGCFAAGLLVLRRLAQNSEALTLTPEKLTVRQPNGREYALKWHEIRSFREADINGQPFIAVITSEPQKPAAQRHNRLRLWLRRLDERLTGSAINISPSSIHCRRDELYETLCEYLEKYGR
ncbi:MULTISPECIES: STM3941 family protein [Alistipes]|uniref:STM3941 family protein n=1 Tax=Alistipes TaxID=239759 RepID=UPI00242AAE0E|nr:STM3941 family protein [Alistipes finegoldii]